MGEKSLFSSCFQSESKQSFTSFSGPAFHPNRQHWPLHSQHQRMVHLFPGSAWCGPRDPYRARKLIWSSRLSSVSTRNEEVGASRATQSHTRDSTQLVHSTLTSREPSYGSRVGWSPQDHSEVQFTGKDRVFLSWPQNSDVRRQWGPSDGKSVKDMSLPEYVYRPAGPQGQERSWLRLGKPYVLRNFSDGEVLADCPSFEV